MRDLNEMEVDTMWEITEAHCINNRGQIVALGVASGQAGRAPSVAGFR